MQVTAFQNLSESEQKEIWSFWELFMVWLVRAEREAVAGGQLWSVWTPLIATKKTVKSQNKNNRITSYACWPPVIKRMHEFPNERPASV